MRRPLRFAAPVAVAGVIGLGATLPGLAAGATVPKLAPISAATLLADVQGAHAMPMSGSVTWTANLGLPSISGLTSAGGQQISDSTGVNPTTLLSGTHTVNVWADGSKARLQLPSTLAETDVVRNGNQAWLYDSSNQHVTHYVFNHPAAGAGSTGKTGWTGYAPLGSGGSMGMGSSGGALLGSGGSVSATGSATTTALTPQQVAANILAKVTPSTQVNVAPGADVAGQHTYQLQLSPRPGTPGAAQSTLARVVISVDATNWQPLQVSVYGSGQAAAALQIGYSSVTFATPAASNFVAPVGTSTTTKTINPGTGAHPSMPMSGSSANRPQLTGSPWAEVLTMPGGSQLAQSEQLTAATTAVSGPFGSARLLHTTLFNALILPDGRVLAGFVTPSVLEAAAGSAG